MAKELPYFKFNASEWISGAITLEDMTTQGAFINICAYYWFKSGSLTLTEIKRRLKLKQATIDSLTHGNHIKVDQDVIEISFLNEQFDELGHISKKNSLNGSKGGAPKGNKNAQKNNPKQPKTTNIEEEVEENRKREERKVFVYGKHDEDKYILITPNTIDGLLYRINGEDGFKELYDIKQSKISHPNLVKDFLRSYPGKHFDDFRHVYNTFNQFIEKKYN